MPLLEALLAGGESLALLRDHVNEARTFERAHGGEGVDQPIDVVAVDRTEVPKAELLEQHARREKGLDALLPLSHERADGRERPRRVVDELTDR